MSNSFSIIQYNKDLIYDAFHLSKQYRLSFPTSIYATSQYFELAHMDIWDPINVHSINGFQYFLTIVDDFSIYTLTFFTDNKSETITHIQNFIAYCQTQFSYKI